MNHLTAIRTRAKWASGAAFYILAAIVISAMFPNIALAAPNFGFTPSCNDRSYTDYLAPIFGNLFSCGGGAVGSGGATSGAGGGSAFQAAVGILNAAALTFGGILAAYTLLVGTMQTAHDGEMLGKKWSSMWLPIRTTLGVGLVVPINNGYCVAQMIIAFLIGQGVGLADSIWTTYLGKLSSPQGMAPTQRIPEVTELAKGILTSQICVKAFNNFQANPTGSVLAIYPNPMSMTTNGDTISFGLPGSGGGAGNECGSVTYSKFLSPSLLAQNVSHGYSAIMTSATLQEMNTVDAAHIAAASTMANTLGTTAEKIVNFRDKSGAEPNPAGDINTAVIAYQNSVSQTASQASSSQSAMQTFFTNAANDGWYLAGAWFMKAAAMQDVVNSAISNVPTTTPPSDKLLTDISAKAAMAPYFSTLDNLVHKQAPKAASAASSSLSNMSHLELSNNASSNWFQHTISWLSQGIGYGIYKAVHVNPSRSAVMSIKDLGDYVMTASELGMASGVVLVAGASAIDSTNKSFLGNVASTVTLGASSALGGASVGAMTMIGYILLALSSIFFGMGAAIAVYLPFAPFLIFFGAFIGWLILCGEAILAAPLWAVMHLTPSGDDIMGGARQGYMLILGLIFRPALIILGFIFAITAIDVIVQGFNGVFFPAFQMAMTGSVMGLGTIIVMLGIYFGTMVWLFHTIFGLIHVIPDKLLRWIGGGHESLGESAKGISTSGQRGGDTAARHGDALRQNAMTAGQTAMQVNAAKNARDDAKAQRMDGLSQQAETSQMQEKKAGIQASLANAKADSPVANMEDRVAAVGENMSHADAAEQAVKDRSTAQGQKASKEDLAAARAPHEAKARERADEISVSAKNSASLVNSSSSPDKIMHAQSDLRAASAARQMISDHEGATQLDQMADNLGKAKSASSAQQSSNPSSPDQNTQNEALTWPKLGGANEQTSSNTSQTNASTKGKPTPPADTPPPPNDPTKQGE